MHMQVPIFLPLFHVMYHIENYQYRQNLLEPLLLLLHQINPVIDTYCVLLQLYNLDNHQNVVQLKSYIVLPLNLPHVSLYSKLHRLGH